MFSIITVSHGHEEDCSNLLDSLLAHYDERSFEMIVIDNLNHSTILGPRLSAIRNQYPNFRYTLIENSTPRSFSYNNNVGVSIASSDTILLLNPDIIIEDRYLLDFINFERLEVGTFYFPSLLNKDRSPQAHIKVWPNFFFQVLITLYSLFGRQLTTHEGQDWAFAAAVLFKKETFVTMGGFDERFLLYCEDVELCHRLKKLGGGLVFLKEIKLVHCLGGESKSKHMRQAIISNIYLRYRYLRNHFLRPLWGSEGNRRASGIASVGVGSTNDSHS